jgi:hypothetical protein
VSPHLADIECFSTVGVLDIPLGALLLYYLPHTVEGCTGREIGEEQRVKGCGQEGHRSAYKHTAASSGQHGSTSEGKRGDKSRVTNRDRVLEIDKEGGKDRDRHMEGDRDRERDKDRDDGKEFSAETAQTVLPFCVLDIRWLLQLNEQYGKEESKVRDTTGEEDYKGNGSRLEKKTGLGYGKSMNEDDARSISTTSRKEEVLDSIQFLQNSVVIITKTHTVLRTVRHARPSTTDINSHHDSPHSPHFNANTSSSRVEVGGWVGKGVHKGVHRHAGKEVGREVVREVLKEVGKVVGKSRSATEEAVSGLSGQIEGNESTEKGKIR